MKNGIQPPLHDFLQDIREEIGLVVGGDQGLEIFGELLVLGGRKCAQGGDAERDQRQPGLAVQGLRLRKLLRGFLGHRGIGLQ